jgi:Spy/CpxP family protein refolding chaperone
MKNKILGFLLIISLGLNIGVLVTFGHHWFFKKGFDKFPKESSWQKARVKKMLDLTDDQAKAMEEKRKQLQDTITPLKEELKNKRTELFTLLDSDNVDSLKADKLVNEISVLQMKIEKAVIEHSINVRKTLNPEQQKKFKAFLRKGFEHHGHGSEFMEK